MQGVHITMPSASSKVPFPAGEAAIAKDAYYVAAYAKNVLKGPFPGR
jgi:hypothetical protein